MAAKKCSILLRSDSSIALNPKYEHLPVLEDLTKDGGSQKVRDFLKEVNNVRQLVRDKHEEMEKATQNMSASAEYASALYAEVEEGTTVRNATESFKKSTHDLLEFQEQLGEDITSLTTQNTDICNCMDEIRVIWKDMWKAIEASRKRASVLEEDLVRLRQHIRDEIDAMNKRVEEKALALEKLLAPKEIPSFPPRKRKSLSEDSTLEVGRQLPVTLHGAEGAQDSDRQGEEAAGVEGVDQSEGGNDGNAGESEDRTAGGSESRRGEETVDCEDTENHEEETETNEEQTKYTGEQTENTEEVTGNDEEEDEEDQEEDDAGEEEEDDEEEYDEDDDCEVD